MPYRFNVGVDVAVAATGFGLRWLGSRIRLFAVRCAVLAVFLCMLPWVPLMRHLKSGRYEPATWPEAWLIAVIVELGYLLSQALEALMRCDPAESAELAEADLSVPDSPDASVWRDRNQSTRSTDR